MQAVNIRDIFKDNGVQAGGEAEVHCRLPRCGGEAEGADELTRRREEGMLWTFIHSPNFGRQQVGTTVRGRGLARNVSNYIRRC